MRPWRVGELARELHGVDTTALSVAERRTLREVMKELGSKRPDPSYLAGVGGGLAASSYSRRPEFELRETGDSRVTPEVRALLSLEFGPGLLMLDTRYLEDLEDDPDYAGTPGRMQLKSDATYGLFNSTYFDLDIGSLSRNWGPQGFPGLLVSNWPLNYDHLYLELGPRRLHLSMLVTELDDARNPQGQLANRYFVAHRLAATPLKWLDLALWQGTVFSGVNRNIDLGFLNPFQFTNISRSQRRVESNVMLGGDAQVRTGRFILSASLFGDDFDFGSDEPYSFGGTATASTSLGHTSVWLGYTLVSNLAYRSSIRIEGPLLGIDSSRQRYGTGLGRNFADYHQLTLRVTTVPLAGLVARPELTMLMQGEGDPRSPMPPAADFPNTPVFLDGTVETTFRVGLALTLRPFSGATLDLSGGIHHIRNADHLPGTSRTRGVGAVAARYLFQFGGPIGRQ
jgi:hypothetical protein